MGIKDTSSTSAIEKMDNNTGKIHLKRELGLISAVSMIAGTMIGSGIFMSPQWVLYYIRSPGASLLIWAACGLLAMLGALCYAELGTVIKESGGDYIYILRNIGPLPAFLLVYTTVIVVRPASIAVVSLSFAEYVMAAFFSDCPSPQVVLKCTAVACVLVLGIINCLNVRLAMSIMIFFTAAKLIVLVGIIVGGVVLLVQGNTQVLQNAFENTAVGFGPVGVAFYQGLWSYEGWNNLNYITEELKNPEVNLPRAVMIAIPLVTCVYLLANISYFAAMTPQELLTSDAVAISWGLKVLGTWTWIITVGVALSTFGSANGTLFSGGRVCYKAAMEGHLPDALSMLHVKRLTPSPALIFTCFMSIIMIIPGDFSSIVNFFSFTAWLFYGTTIASLIYMKIKQPDIPRPYKVPIIIPVIVLIASVYLVLAPVIDSPQMEYLYVTIFILSGPDALSMLHVKRLTPSPALIFTCFMSIIMIIPGDFSSIVNFFSFTAWLFYGTTIASLIYMKIKQPDIPRPYKVPIIIPVIVLIASVYLVLAPVIDSPQMEYLYVTIFILSGVIIYIPVIHYKWSPGWFHSITLHLQLLLQVAPTDKND